MLKLKNDSVIYILTSYITFTVLNNWRTVFVWTLFL